MKSKEEKLEAAIKEATDALYRSPENEFRRWKPDAEKLEIQLAALRLLLECLRMEIGSSEENGSLLNMVKRAIEVARFESARYHERKSGVTRLEWTIDALCDVLFVCEAAGFDPGTI